MTYNKITNFHKSPKSEINSMVKIERTNAQNISFQNLIQELDNNLWAMYNNHDYKFNVDINVENIETVVLASIGNITVGGGCFKVLNDEIVEVKRMFVNPYFRGLGVASNILDELITWARELGYTTVVLETGLKQQEAINLYEKHGFSVISNFGAYVGMPESICMGRSI
jgi:GNAT superfamily N-acetyltransferase